MNGRIQGDMEGNFTFHALGQNRKSVIDYFIASPSFLTYPEASLIVTPPNECPNRPGGKPFDHMPITLTIPYVSNSLMREQDSRVESSIGAPAPRIRWPNHSEEAYSDIMALDTDISKLLSQACDKRGTLLDNENALLSAIRLGLNKCNPEALVTTRPKCTAHSLPRNKWYNNACKAARQAALLAEKIHGPKSAETSTANRQYKNTIRRAKRVWIDSSSEALRNSLCKNPRAFWSKIHGCSKCNSSISLDDWSSYFADLLSSNSQSRPGLNASEMVLNMDDVRAREGASSLNQCFSLSEVSNVLKRLKNNSSPGVDGFPAELFRYADDSGDFDEGFTSALTSIFNRVIVEGYPAHWASSALAPVPKPKGNPNNKDDYRGIAVGNSISKIFSLCLLNRLDTWAEENGIRAAGQSGFRMKRGTADATFTLNHLGDKYHSHRKPLYVAFVDFKKAYDWVDRSLLWECLNKLGVHGDCLKALKSMYADVSLQVRINGQLGSPFSSETGVKQGDPLSPLLFGIFIDRIEEFLKDKHPNLGARLEDNIIQVLLYADDLALLAENPGDMQRLLNCLHDFCIVSGLQVSIKKSEIVVLNSQYCVDGDLSNAKRLTYNNQPICLTPSFVYLGTLMSDKHPSDRKKEAAARMFAKAKTAAFLMFRRCYSIGLHNVSMQLYLFDSLVRPILNFGCEIWGPTILKDKVVSTSHKCETWHRAVLKQMLGVCTSTTNHIVMEELSRLPLCFEWLKQSLRFWNKVISRNKDDLVYTAMNESIRLNIGWTNELQCALRNLGCDIKMEENKPINVTEVLNQVSLKWKHIYPIEPNEVRKIPDMRHTGFKSTKYQKWFSPIPDISYRPFTSTLHRSEQIRIIAQFRMCSSHWLNCEGMRKVGRAEIPRSRRICELCNYNKCEDEMHIFECPFYNDIRLRFQRLFLWGKVAGNVDMTIWNVELSDENMRCLVNGNGSDTFWSDMADYLLLCKKKRQERLADIPPI